MRVTTTSKLTLAGKQLLASVTLPDGKIAQLTLENPKWDAEFEPKTLDGKTYKLQGEVTLAAAKSARSKGPDGVFTIQRMKRASFTPR